MIDPETINRIMDWAPFLSMGRADGQRRLVVTRLAEQLLFAGAITLGVLWLNQRDDHRDMEELKRNYTELNQRLDRIERRIENQVVSETSGGNGTRLRSK